MNEDHSDNAISRLFWDIEICYSSRRSRICSTDVIPFEVRLANRSSLEISVLTLPQLFRLEFCTLPMIFVKSRMMLVVESLTGPWSQRCPTRWGSTGSGVHHRHSPMVGIFRQEHWSRLLFPSPKDFPDPEIKPAPHALASRFYHWAYWWTVNLNFFSQQHESELNTTHFLIILSLFPDMGSLL